MKSCRFTRFLYVIKPFFSIILCFSKKSNSRSIKGSKAGEYSYKTPLSTCPKQRIRQQRLLKCCMAQNRSILFKASDLIPSYFYQFIHMYLRYWYKIVEIVTLRVNIAHSTCQNFISNVKILFLGSVVRSQNSGTKIRCYENKPPVQVDWLNSNLSKFV